MTERDEASPSLEPLHSRATTVARPTMRSRDLADPPEDHSPLSKPGTPPTTKQTSRQMGVIVAVVIGWTLMYNMVIKGQPPLKAFFEILNTVSDDLVLGALVTITVGVGIALVFSITKLYTQIIANIYSFRILELMLHEDLRRWQFRQLVVKLLNFQDQPTPDRICPERPSSLLFSFAFIYVMSWIYLVLFSEALFFVSWSAGVDLDVTDQTLLLMPTLALAIPFSARVMAYVRYPYAQDYADFMPGAVFVLVLVTSLGYLFESDDQRFWLLRVWQNESYLVSFLRNGAFLAFVPVFFEAMYWLLDLTQQHRKAEISEDQAAGQDAP